MNQTSLMTRCSLLAFALFATCGCYWGRRPLDDLTPSRHAPVWIWTGDSVQKWHAVRSSSDSISGIPFRKSVTCESCRQSLPRTGIDSAKVGYQTGLQRRAEFVLSAVALTVAEAGLCRAIAPGDRDC